MFPTFTTRSTHDKVRRWLTSHAAMAALSALVCFALLDRCVVASIELQVGNDTVTGGDYAYFSTGDHTGAALAGATGNGASASVQLHQSCDDFGHCSGTTYASVYILLLFQICRLLIFNGGNELRRFQ